VFNNGQNKKIVKLSSDNSTSLLTLGDSYSIWDYQTIPAANGINVIGGSGGGDYTINEYATTVQNIQIWWGNGSPNNGFKQMNVTLFNGNKYTAGTNGTGGSYAEFTFKQGEYLVGDLILCGNGVGTRAGYIKFTTNLNNTFEAGQSHTQ